MAKKVQFMYKDLTGRGFSSKMSLEHLTSIIDQLADKTAELDEYGNNEFTELSDYLDSAEIGQEFESRTYKLIRI